MKYNLSKIMKRAWELVKKAGITIAEGLKEAWREFKIEALRLNLENMAYSCKYINLGINRVAVVKKWVNGDARRMYLNLNCYTMNGRYKGRYNAGYVDLITGEYILSKYDDIDARNKEYIR